MQNVSRSRVASTLTQLGRVAACSLVGPSGLILSPSLAIVAEWIGDLLGKDVQTAGTIARVLAGVFEHLGGDAARGVISSLGTHSNHDVETATAAAIRAALAAASDKIAAPNRFFEERFEDWFSLWDDYLRSALESSEGTSSLFRSDSLIDAIALSATPDDQWWPGFRPVLLRWASEQNAIAKHTVGDVSSLPRRLDGYLSNTLLGLAREAFNVVLRDEQYQRAWIAWQQRFLGAMAQEVRLSDARVADSLDNLTLRSEELHSYLERSFDRLDSRFDQLQFITLQILQLVRKQIEGGTSPSHKQDRERVKVATQKVIRPYSIGLYQALEEIGKGGFGTVYKTRHPDTQALVALKRFEPTLFRPDERDEARERFLRGGRIMQRLNHPHIVEIFELNEKEAYLAMKLASRGSLPAFLEENNKTQKAVSFQARVRLAIQISEAVAYAHREGVLHRDICPSNVLIEEDRIESPSALLADFDLAFQRGRTQLTGRERNWHFYLPRDLRAELEKIERMGIRELSQLRLTRPGVEADLYSLAMVVLFMFTGFEPGPEGVRAEIEQLKKIWREDDGCSKAQIGHLASTLEHALLSLSEGRFTDAELLREELIYLVPPRSSVGSEGMVLVAGGPFFMGSDELRHAEEYPRHLVRVSDFYLDQFPVTNKNFKQFLDDDANADWRPGGISAKRNADENYLAHWSGLQFPEGTANLPVVFVSWHAAVAFADWAGKCLPTEAEWEYAAHAGTETVYWFGDKVDPGRINLYNSRNGQLTPVDAYPPNAWGLFDMLGNAEEWCADWYSRDFYQNAPGSNPRGPVDGNERVCRGGSYESPADMVRCGARGKAGPRMCSGHIGFRCARRHTSQRVTE